jgi:hypothetical protein
MFEDLFNIESGASASQAMDAEQAEELLKTLQVGHGYASAAGPQLVGGGALGVESIDGTLKSVTYDASNLVMWPSVPQDRAYSLVEQYVRINAYGDAGSPYIPESGSPVMNDASYQRHAQKVMFMSTRRGVSLASTLVKQNFGGDIEGRETNSGTLWMLERLERELYKANADYSSDGEFTGAIGSIPIKMQNLNLMGAEQQIRLGDDDFSAQSKALQGFGGTTSVIQSKEGDILNESDIESLANILVENFGRPSELHLAPKQLSDFIKQFYPKERVNQLGVQDGKAGYIVRQMVTTAGGIDLRPNVFLKPKELKKNQADRQGVPAAPAGLENVATNSVVEGSGNPIDETAGTTTFTTGDIVRYEVTAVNEQGEGSGSLISEDLTIAADGNSASFFIVDPAAGNVPTHYAVYRTEKDAGTALTSPRSFIGYVRRSGTKTKFTDKNKKAPGSATAYMFDMRPEVFSWKQLAPLLKINLAAISTAKEFLLWLAGTLIMYAPRKSGLIENIGKA